jgi:hypothetical protein
MAEVNALRAIKEATEAAYAAAEEAPGPYGTGDGKRQGRTEADRLYFDRGVEA